MIGAKSRYRYLLVMMLWLLSIPLSACDASARRAQVEAQVVAFMLDHIVQNYASAHVTYSALEEGGEKEAVPVPSIIIWAPPGKGYHSPHEILEYDQPYRVWMYVDRQLSVAEQASAAIELYERDFINYPLVESWGYYGFGIFSVSRDMQQAEVYLGISCGPMCGSGYMYTLQRNPSGAWEITETELVWIV